MTLWIEEHTDLKVGKDLGWLDHFALKCETRGEVDRAYEFCKSQGLEILTEPKAYPAYGDFYGFSFRGPNGIKLEFVIH
jgi:catechol 2,3-dioxygenase-like lactoylglutathione lyase family enzyme